MNCTRSDIAYVIRKLSRYTNNLNDDHWNALLRVVGYLKNIKEYALRYRKYPPVLERYNDANWIANSKKSKSTSGYIFTLEMGDRILKILQINLHSSFHNGIRIYSLG